MLVVIVAIVVDDGGAVSADAPVVPESKVSVTPASNNDLDVIVVVEDDEDEEVDDVDEAGIKDVARLEDSAVDDAVPDLDSFERE